MKILYILGAYKPKPSANGICSENVIEALREAGHEVTILANDVKYGKEKDSGIYHVKQRLFLRLVEIGERCSQDDPVKSKVILKSAWILNKIQLLIMSPLWPRVSIITNRRFKNKALQLQKQMKFDMVISVYTPIEALLAGYEVKKKILLLFLFRIFWIRYQADMDQRYFQRKILGIGD